MIVAGASVAGRSGSGGIVPHFSSAGGSSGSGGGFVVGLGVACGSGGRLASGDAWNCPAIPLGISGFGDDKFGRGGTGTERTELGGGVDRFCPREGCSPASGWIAGIARGGIEGLAFGTGGAGGIEDFAFAPGGAGGIEGLTFATVGRIEDLAFATGGGIEGLAFASGGADGVARGGIEGADFFVAGSTDGYARGGTECERFFLATGDEASLCAGADDASRGATGRDDDSSSQPRSISSTETLLVPVAIAVSRIANGT